MESLELDAQKQKKSKLIITGLLLLVMLAIAFTSYLLLSRPPEIIFEKEVVPDNSLVVPFERDGIKKVFLEDNNLHIILDSPTSILGYYVDGYDGELTVSLYQKN